MKSIEINGNKYDIKRNDEKCIIIEELKEKVTDYFEPYDYIVGDYSYEKMRLKGFYETNNKKVKKINDIKNLDNYIENYCNYGAKIFILKKIK